MDCSVEDTLHIFRIIELMFAQKEPVRKISYREMEFAKKRRLAEVERRYCAHSSKWIDGKTS